MSGAKSRTPLSPRERAIDALQEAQWEADRASRALEDAIEALRNPRSPAFTTEEHTDAVERLIRVSKSLLNEDGVFTRYDLALAINDAEASL